MDPAYARAVGLTESMKVARNLLDELRWKLSR